MNSEITNPIEALAARLQMLPPSVRWLYPSGVIEAVALGQRPERGPWSRRADRLVALASRFGLAGILAATVNMLLLIATCARQRMVCRTCANGALFLGIKALREKDLIRQFETIQGKSVIQIDERGLGDFFRLANVPVGAALREMRSIWNEVREQRGLSRLPEGINRGHLLVFFLMHGHEFAYVRAWFRRYLALPGAERTVACTTASLVPFAAVAAGVEVVHMEHGFQRRSLVYPDYAQSVCFNAFDADHIRRRLPRCSVALNPESAQFLATRRAVAVAGTFWEPDGFDLIRPFVEWALRNELPVIVRKHPIDTSDYWEQWRGMAGIEIVDAEDGFIEFLDKTRPRMLASWFSTALFDALIRGIVPVTVTPQSHEAVLDTVFPFRELSLCWPEHERFAQKLLDDDGLRLGFVSENYARAMATHDGAVLSDVAPAKQAKPA